MPLDAEAWARALDELSPPIHPVDQLATRIWFRFFPLRLAEAVAGATDVAALERTLRLEGRYRLADQVDSSHWFLYGHRYWDAVKARLARADPPGAAPAPSSPVVRDLASQTAGAVRVDVSLVVGISAVAVMTRQQVGDRVFDRPVQKAAGVSPLLKSPDEICLEPPKGTMRKASSACFAATGGTTPCGSTSGGPTAGSRSSTSST